MKKIKLFQDSILTNEADFKTEAELNEWIEKHREQGNFLLTEKTEVTRDIEGNETVTVIPPTHTFEILDISAEIAAQEARRKKREDARKALKNLDFDKITTVTALKAVVANILEVTSEG